MQYKQETFKSKRFEYLQSIIIFFILFYFFKD